MLSCDLYYDLKIMRSHFCERWHYVASKEGRLEVGSFDFSVHYSFLLYGVSYPTSFFIRWNALDLCYNLNVKSSPGFWSLSDGTIWGSCKSVVGRTLLEKGTGLRICSLVPLSVWYLLPEYGYNMTILPSAPATATLPSGLPFRLPRSPHQNRLYHSKVLSQKLFFLSPSSSMSPSLTLRQGPWLAWHLLYRPG